MQKVLIETNRTGYSTDQVDRTITVGELIEMLSEFDEDAKIYLSNDNGYTYGGIWYNSIYEESEESE